MRRVLKKRKAIDAAMTAIHPPARERRAGPLRRAPRHAAQYQIPSHCVAHSWQSDFAHCMHTAKAGRCWWTAQRWTIALWFAWFIGERQSLARNSELSRTSVHLGNEPILSQLRALLPYGGEGAEGG